MFSQQEDWQMTNWISPLLFTAFHKCWIISIGWIVFRLLTSSSGKMPGIDNCTRYTQRFIISSVIFNINTIGQSSSCWSWLSLGQFLLPCQYLQALLLIPTTSWVLGVELEAQSTQFMLTLFVMTLLQGALRTSCRLQTQGDSVVPLELGQWL